MPKRNFLDNRIAVKMIKELLTKGICRPVVQYGKGARTSYNDVSSKIFEFVRKDAVIVGNDAPRGGKLGKFIKIK